MTYYASKHGAGRANTEQAIAARKPFKSGGALSADTYRDRLGYLSGDELERFIADQPTYVVRSYNTPIAWWSEEHGWTVPDRKYSPTTTRHQSVVRGALR